MAAGPSGFPGMGRGRDHGGRHHPPTLSPIPVGTRIPSPEPDQATRIILEQITTGLADSVNARLSLAPVIVHVENGNVTIPLGASDGIRKWSTVTLTGAARAWMATVSRLDDHSTILSALDPPTAELPADGSTLSVRVEYRKMALFPAAPAGGLSRLGLDGLETAFARDVAARTGMTVLRSPVFPDSAESRAVAADSGAEMLARIAVERTAKGLDVLLSLERTIRNGATPPAIRMSVPLSAAELAELGRGDTFESAPPGCRFEAARDSIPGLVIDVLPNRYHGSELLAFHPDRIDTWLFEPDSVLETGSQDLDLPWPRVVPTRWPVGSIVPVNSVYGQDKKEEKVYYAACSNQRPRYLTIEVDRENPDSLGLSISKGPRDSLSSCFDSCFPRVDRVNRPKDYRLPANLPGTAVARLVLSEVIVGPSRVPAVDETGRARSKMVAVVYYDEPSASAWISMADSAWQVPGAFGSEMAAYRAGTTGPPGVLLTSAAAPLEGDHVELWVLHDRHLERSWRSADFPDGSITALFAGDLDGDHRDDIVLCEGVAGPPDSSGSGFVTKLYILKSRPASSGTPW